MADPGSIYGVPVYQNVHLTIHRQFRFPISKKRRIRKKWSKRARNHRQLPDPGLYKIAGMGLMGHPVTIGRLRATLATESPDA